MRVLQDINPKLKQLARHTRTSLLLSTQTDITSRRVKLRRQRTCNDGIILPQRLGTVRNSYSYSRANVLLLPERSC